MKAFWTYTILRLGILLGCYAIFAGAWWAVKGGHAINGPDMFIVLIVSAVVSSAVSLRLLAPQREKFAAQVQKRAERATSKFDERRSREDRNQ